MKRLRIIGLIIVVALLLGILAGCATSNSVKEEVISDGERVIRTSAEAAPLAPIEGKELAGDQERFDSYVYSVEKLKANYKNVVVLDARTKEEYDKGHLPGAVQAHWRDWSNVQVKQGEKGWAQILPNEVLKEKFGALGIDGTKPVVIYNDPLVGWGEEGRQLWTFRVFGLENTFILNGGIKAWTAAGGGVTKDTAVVKAVTGPEPNPNPELFASLDYLKGKLGKVNILDVREDEEYAGTKVYGEKQPGRIPGVQHIWFKDFYNADGTLQSPAQIRGRVESVGYMPQDEVILYCTGGIRSGFATMALQIAGYEKARNYNNSFSEWVGTGQEIDTEVYKEIK
ncbi:Thiosulfate sulfurtransferase [Sporotomaculum syntrophicum]|uniref:thiosulfate sulfurtransferase n=1 Tax=Sporotomaculum syntrophicum TaxID=182264 RepID=A0A9D3AWN3_9FIRM|nr:rhodanese-like domain-containing protein [Sporotomaculum syntrophicum]KAF1084027.1 Thiosulfate sulfurtransferase [Sporotomaculum syntrophicum]